MTQLSADAKIHLSITHKRDVFKVLQQTLIVHRQMDAIADFNGLPKEEVGALITSLQKYYNFLQTIQ